MTEQEFRERVVGMVGDQPIKIWLTMAAGHRLDFRWSVGVPRNSDSITLARTGFFYLVGQDVPESMKLALLDLFYEFCRSDEARQAEASIRRIRFVPT